MIFLWLFNDKAKDTSEGKDLHQRKQRVFEEHAAHETPASPELFPQRHPMGILARQTGGENGLLCRRDVIRNPTLATWSPAHASNASMFSLKPGKRFVSLLLKKRVLYQN